jgi:hypothetical protein
VAVLTGGVGQVIEARDRTADAVKAAVDEDANGAGPARHDLVQRQALKLGLRHKWSPKTPYVRLLKAARPCAGAKTLRHRRGKGRAP